MPKYGDFWFDTHTHLNDQAYDNDRADVLRRMEEAGIGRALVVGYDLASSRRAVELAERYDNLYAAVGVHPHDAKDFTAETVGELRSLLETAKTQALGEVGLDYHYDHSPRPVQQAVFRAQIRLAAETKRPLVIHQREAFADTLRILQEERAGKIGGVMHCFSGSPETVKLVLDMGFYISVGGPATFANARRLPEVIRTVPVDRLLLETDCPYLTPHPYRGTRNEPAYLPLIGEAVAGILGLSPEEIARRTWENANRLFGIRT